MDYIFNLIYESDYFWLYYILYAYLQAVFASRVWKYRGDAEPMTCFVVTIMFAPFATIGLAWHGFYATSRYFMGVGKYD